jgi:hypothetical protein
MMHWSASRLPGARGWPAEVVVERFVRRQNIEHYRAMIKNATDLERRGVFKKLLRDEEAKLKKYEEDHKKK